MNDTIPPVAEGASNLSLDQLSISGAPETSMIPPDSTMVPAHTGSPNMPDLAFPFPSCKLPLFSLI
jgi:hypothetical protein